MTFAYIINKGGLQQKRRWGEGLAVLGLPLLLEKLLPNKIFIAHGKIRSQDLFLRLTMLLNNLCNVLSVTI